MKSNQAGRPRLKESELFVMLVVRLLAKMRVWVIVGTLLSVCAVAYGIMWAMTKRQG
jgi:hypothetical protein